MWCRLWPGLGGGFLRLPSTGPNLLVVVVVVVVGGAHPRHVIVTRRHRIRREIRMCTTVRGCVTVRHLILLSSSFQNHQLHASPVPKLRRRLSETRTPCPAWRHSGGTRPAPGLPLFHKPLFLAYSSGYGSTKLAIPQARGIYISSEISGIMICQYGPRSQRHSTFESATARPQREQSHLVDSCQSGHSRATHTAMTVRNVHCSEHTAMPRAARVWGSTKIEKRC
jgi:hypothetical protein